MKKYIKTARYVGYSTNKLKQQLAACKKDIKLLARCDTVEDLETTQWNSWRFDKFLVSQIQGGRDFDDVIDSAIESLHEQISKLRNDIADAEEYEVATDEAFEAARDVCQAYNILSETDDRIVVSPVNNADHDDCIAFIDEIVEAIHGKYVETGRGGSWTSWNLQSADGGRLKAGWTDDDNWYVEKY